MKLLLPLFCLLLLGSCARGPRFDEQVLGYYQDGALREEVQKKMAVDPLASVVRPKDGWQAQRDSNRGADAFAARYEPEAKVVVQRVDVYWIGRGTSVPLIAGGVWWDYVFYDAADRLVGYRRRFLD